MALPKLLQILFENSGAGPKLNKGVLPDIDQSDLPDIPEDKITSVKASAIKSIDASALPAATDSVAGAVKLADVVRTAVQSLSETVQTQVLTNLGVISAIEELIVEYGGTVPTSLSSQSATTMAAGSDPWGDFN